MATPAIQNNNPGNLKDPTTGQFQTFPTPQAGFAALLNDLEAKKSGTSSKLGPNATLIQFAQTYAPASDKNNPGQYAANLANYLKVRPDASIGQIPTQNLAAAVAHAEDNSSPFGNIPPNAPNTPISSTDATPPNALTEADQQSAQDTGATFPVTSEEISSGNLPATTAKAVGNLPSSFLHLGGGLLSAAMHPLKTIEGIGSTLVGGASELGRKLGTGANVGKPPTNEEKTFDAVAQTLKNRYGTVENAARSATNDPAGVGTDILTILEGGTAGLDKMAGTGTNDALNAGLLTTAKPAVTGVKSLAKAPFKLAAQTLGLQTGVKGDVITQALNSSAEGGEANKAFLDGLRGNTSPEQLVSQARDALEQVVQDRGKVYSKMLEPLGADKTTYDISPIYKAVNDQLASFKVGFNDDGSLDFSRSRFALDTTAQKDIENLVNYVKSYGGKAGDRTALGIDNLKQVLGGYYSPNSDYRAFVQGVKSTTRKVLNDAPGYTDAMSQYSDMTDNIKTITKSLSLGDNASAETAFNKITSALRNNAFRKSVLQNLDNATGGKLMSGVAGQQLSSIMPRGLAPYVEGGLAGVTGLVAGAGGIMPILAMMMTSSPRLVGEFVHALGIGVRGTNILMSLLNKVATPSVLGSGLLNRALPPR